MIHVKFFDVLLQFGLTIKQFVTDQTRATFRFHLGNLVVIVRMSSFSVPLQVT